MRIIILLLICSLPCFAQSQKIHEYQKDKYTFYDPTTTLSKDSSSVSLTSTDSSAVIVFTNGSSVNKLMVTGFSLAQSIFTLASGEPLEIVASGTDSIIAYIDYDSTGREYDTLSYKWNEGTATIPLYAYPWTLTTLTGDSLGTQSTVSNVKNVTMDWGSKDSVSGTDTLFLYFANAGNRDQTLTISDSGYFYVDAASYTIPKESSDTITVVANLNQVTGDYQTTLNFTFSTVDSASVTSFSITAQIDLTQPEGAPGAAPGTPFVSDSTSKSATFNTGLASNVEVNWSAISPEADFKDYYVHIWDGTNDFYYSVASDTFKSSGIDSLVARNTYNFSVATRDLSLQTTYSDTVTFQFKPTTTRYS